MNHLNDYHWKNIEHIVCKLMDWYIYIYIYIIWIECLQNGISWLMKHTTIFFCFPWFLRQLRNYMENYLKIEWKIQWKEVWNLQFSHWFSCAHSCIKSLKFHHLLVECKYWSNSRDLLINSNVYFVLRNNRLILSYYLCYINMTGLCLSLLWKFS